MSENAWIEWSGGPCPVPHNAAVEVRYRDGQTEFLPRASVAVAIGPEGSDWWMHDGEHMGYDDADNLIVDHGADIIAYRLSGPSA